MSMLKVAEPVVAVDAPREDVVAGCDNESLLSPAAIREIPDKSQHTRLALQ
jgi:hypothetical protein